MPTAPPIPATALATPSANSTWENTTEDGGVNKDIEVWPDASGRVPWTARFIDYLKQHGRMKDLAFVSFEYPYDPCKTPWGVLF